MIETFFQTAGNPFPAPERPHGDRFLARPREPSDGPQIHRSGSVDPRAGVRKNRASRADREAIPFRRQNAAIASCALIMPTRAR
jgi:hypothetical protein